MLSRIKHITLRMNRLKVGAHTVDYWHHRITSRKFAKRYPKVTHQYNEFWNHDESPFVGFEFVNGERLDLDATRLDPKDVDELLMHTLEEQEANEMLNAPREEDPAAHRYYEELGKEFEQKLNDRLDRLKREASKTENQ